MRSRAILRLLALTTLLTLASGRGYSQSRSPSGAVPEFTKAFTDSIEALIQQEALVPGPGAGQGSQGIASPGTPGTPGTRTGVCGDYDPVRGRFVIYGGNGLPGTVWSLELSGIPTWRQLSAPNGPSAWYRCSMVYDPVRDRMLVFGGGNGAGGASSELWALSLGEPATWTLIATGGSIPTARQGQAMVYDPVRDRLLVFGGQTGGFSYLNDLNSLSLAGPLNWQLLPGGAAPPAKRVGPAMIYDPVRDRLVMFSGAGPGRFAEQWVYPLTGTPGWSQLNATGGPPPPRFLMASAYDPTSDQMLIWGGDVGFSSPQSWALSLGVSPAWTTYGSATATPAHRGELAYALDPLRSRFMIFGGIYRQGEIPYDDTWGQSLGGAHAWAQIHPPLDFALETVTLPAALVGVAYNQLLVASGGAFPYSWAITAGALPAGLVLSTGGTISGTPTTVQSVDFTVRVTDDAGASLARTLHMDVTYPPLALGPTTLTGAFSQLPYSADFTGSGGLPPYGWTVSAGSLPPGYTLTSAGHLSGVTPSPGTWSFTIRIQDSRGTTTTRSYNLTASAPAFQIVSSATLPTATVGIPYPFSFSTVGAVGPVLWDLTGGALPDGMALSSGGQLSGAPTTSGPASLTLTAHTPTQSAVQTFSLTVYTLVPLTFLTSPALPEAEAELDYSVPIQVSGGTPPYTATVVDGNLPNSLILDSGGLLHGIPHGASNSSFTILFRDNLGGYGHQDFTLTVNAGTPLVIESSLPGGTVTGFYEKQLHSKFGQAPFTWSVPAGELPNGLGLTPGGRIFGTPTLAGDFGFSVQVEDLSGRHSSAPLSVLILPEPTFSTGPTLSSGALGHSYSQGIEVAGGMAPFAYSVLAGLLPGGLTLSAGGVISGTPVQAGVARFRARALDAAGAQTIAGFEITIVPPGTIFSPAVSLTGATGPAGLGLHDLDGDGRLDLVSANFNGGAGNSVALRMGMPGGGFSPAATFPTGAGAYGVAIGDLDGDGLPEVVVTNRSTTTVSVLRRGPSGFGARQDYAAGTAVAVATGDFNGDGRMDLAVAELDGLAVWITQPDGSLVRTQKLTSAALSDLAVGDIDGDGRLDVVVTVGGLNTGNTFRTYLGLGNGTFTQGTTYNTALGPSGILLGDFNGDHLLDVVVTHLGSGSDNQVYFYAGQGQGRFLLTGALPAGAGARDVVAADFNADGKLDYAVANQAAGTISVYLGKGNTTFFPRADYPVGAGPRRINAADVTGDGILDLIVANYGTNGAGNTVTIYRGVGDGTFGTRTDLTTDIGPGDVAVADFNGDGQADLFVPCATSASFNLFLSSATGLMLSATGGLPVGSISAAAGDFNGDGFPDLAIGAQGLTSVMPWMSSSLFNTFSTFTVHTAPTAVVLGDLDGDAIPDLATCNIKSNDLSLLSGAGDGTFNPLTTIAVGVAPAALALGDLNHDGQLDLVVANSGANTAQVVLGNGGGFLKLAAFPAGSRPRGLALDDFNGDGNLDLAVADSGAAMVSVYLGVGDGTFGARTDYPVGAGPVALTAVDLDGNGVLDLATANIAANSVTLLSGNGAGGFSARGNFAVGLQPIAVAAGDVNGDGRPDIVVSNSGSNNLSVLYGSGVSLVAVEEWASVRAEDGPEGVTLRWSGGLAGGAGGGGAGAVRYRVMRSARPAGPFEAVSGEIVGVAGGGGGGGLGADEYSWTDHSVVGGGTYFYELGRSVGGATWEYSGFVRVVTQVRSFALAAPAPNPVFDRVRLAYSLQKSAHASLEVCKVTGERVRVLFDGDRPAGVGVVTWDLRGGGGSAVPTGVYFVRLETGGHRLTRKVMVVGR